MYEPAAKPPVLDVAVEQHGKCMRRIADSTRAREMTRVLLEGSKRLLKITRERVAHSPRKVT